VRTTPSELAVPPSSTVTASRVVRLSLLQIGWVSPVELGGNGRRGSADASGAPSAECAASHHGGPRPGIAMDTPPGPSTFVKRPAAFFHRPTWSGSVRRAATVPCRFRGIPPGGLASQPWGTAGEALLSRSEPLGAPSQATSPSCETTSPSREAVPSRWRRLRTRDNPFPAVVEGAPPAMRSGFAEERTCSLRMKSASLRRGGPAHRMGSGPRTEPSDFAGREETLLAPRSGLLRCDVASHFGEDASLGEGSVS
jgi:hypothetical protein